MNLQQIRNTWMAFEQASGLGAVKDDAHYERMVALADSLVASGQAGEGGGLAAPMPGKVISLIAQPGSDVEQGAPLLILEAMKMEHPIAAPVKGRLKAFRFGVGDSVAEGAELVDFEPAK